VRACVRVCVCDNSVNITPLCLYYVRIFCSDFPYEQIHSYIRFITFQLQLNILIIVHILQIITLQSPSQIGVTYVRRMQVTISFIKNT
jgi:hypothetical protein